MADFCTNCSDLMFGPTIQPDIDIKELSNKVGIGQYLPVLCEGCGMRGVGRDKDNSIILAIPEDVRDFNNPKVEWVKLEDFDRDHRSKYWYHAIPENQD